MEAIKKRLPFSLALASLTAISLAVAGLSLAAGADAHFSWSAFFGGLFHQKGFETETLTLYAVRSAAPNRRGACRGGLSVSGVLLQSVTGNDLASPGIIGVSSGAGFMVILCLSFFPAAFVSVPAAAFAGAVAAPHRSF